MNTTPTTISGLWIGDQLPVIAQLCIRTYLANGFNFQLFTYRDYPNLPEGTIIRDASQIIPSQHIFKHNGKIRAFADWFRNTWLAANGGYWTDLDVLCLRPCPDSPLPLFAEQEPGHVGVAVLGFPAGHPVIEHLRRLSEDPATPMPWDNPELTAEKQALLLSTPDIAHRRQTAPWGANRPHHLTMALKHFNLLQQAAPSASIYPVHYSTWRHSYNGGCNLDSPGLASSWALHLWGQYLEHEPDALANAHPDGIVGQLLAQHGLSQTAGKYIPAPGPKKKVNIVVGMCSCAKTIERRQTLRETWLKYPEPGIETFFFLGESDPPVDEPDTVVLPVNDTYNYLPAKTIAFIKYALDHYDFDWLFKCDDDTYLALGRLAELADPAYDIIGDPSLADRGAPSGGAGYFLSRELAEKIAGIPNPPVTGCEDLIIGKMAQDLGARPLSTERLCLHSGRFPLPDNDMVSSHWCSPEMIRAIETFYHTAPVSEYSATHIHWKDTLVFYPDSTFRRKENGNSGIAEFTEKGVTLKWFGWPPETLHKKQDQYVSDHLTIRRTGHKTRPF